MLDFKMAKHSKKEIMAKLCLDENFELVNLDGEKIRALDSRIHKLWMENLREYNLNKVEKMRNKAGLILIKTENPGPVINKYSMPQRFEKQLMSTKQRINHLFDKYISCRFLNAKDRATLTRLHGYKYLSDKLIKVISYLESKCFGRSYYSILENPPTCLVQSIAC